LLRPVIMLQIILIMFLILKRKYDQHERYYKWITVLVLQFIEPHYKANLYFFVSLFIIKR